MGKLLDVFVLSSTLHNPHKTRYGSVCAIDTIYVMVHTFPYAYKNTSTQMCQGITLQTVDIS